MLLSACITSVRCVQLFCNEHNMISVLLATQASTYQMGVLLMFNNSETLTLEQIQEQTQLKMVHVL